MFVPWRRWLLALSLGAVAACTHLPPDESRFVLPDGRRVSTAAVPPASRPAPRSSLLSSPDLDFRIATTELSPYSITYIAHRDAAHGAIVDQTTDSGKLRHLYWFPHAGRREPKAALLDIVALEYLYTMALAGDAEARYSVRSIDEGKGGSARSQQEALRKVAELRQRAIGSLQQAGDRPVMQWTLVSLEPHFESGHDRAAVRIRGDRGSLKGLIVSFGRAPHSGCEAVSDENGIAGCELVDLHGHKGHYEHDDAPVVATFVGRVTPREVMPPTIVLIRKP